MLQTISRLYFMTDYSYARKKISSKDGTKNLKGSTKQNRSHDI